MYLLYLDESGVRNPQSISVREESNFFVLSGIILKEENYHSVEEKFKIFKKNHLPPELWNVPLHAVELNNLNLCKNKKDYLKWISPKESKEFLKKSYEFIASLPIEAIAIIIDNYMLCERYPFPRGPYSLAYEFLLEKFQKIIDKRSDNLNCLGLVNVAYCDDKVSKKIEEIHINAIEEGSKYVDNYKNILSIIRIQPMNKSVLFEVADMVCYAFSRSYRGWLCKNLNKLAPEEKPEYLEIIDPICNKIKIGKILLGKANLKIFPYPRFLEK